MQYGRAALWAAFLMLAGLARPATAACVDKGGFPFESGVDACLKATQLNSALAASRGALPPANADGGGAPTGYVWQDSSTSPETLRKCVAGTCTGGAYNAGEWVTVGWVIAPTQQVTGSATIAALTTEITALTANAVLTLPATPPDGLTLTVINATGSDQFVPVVKANTGQTLRMQAGSGTSLPLPPGGVTWTWNAALSAWVMG